MRETREEMEGVTGKRQRSRELEGPIRGPPTSASTMEGVEGLKSDLEAGARRGVAGEQPQGSARPAQPGAQWAVRKAGRAGRILESEGTSPFTEGRASQRAQWEGPEKAEEKWEGLGLLGVGTESIPGLRWGGVG